MGADGHPQLPRDAAGSPSSGMVLPTYMNVGDSFFDGGVFCCGVGDSVGVADCGGHNGASYYYNGIGGDRGMGYR
jgi:hypothetical protein